MMYGFFGNGGWGNYGWIMMLGSSIFWLLILAAVVWVLVRLFQGRTFTGEPHRDNAQEILRARFARGEIDEDEFHSLSEKLKS